MGVVVDGRVNVQKVIDRESLPGRTAVPGLEALQLRRFRQALRELETNTNLADLKGYLKARDAFIVCSPTVEYASKRYDMEVIDVSGRSLSAIADIDYGNRSCTYKYVNRGRTYAALVFTSDGFAILVQTHRRVFDPDMRAGVYNLQHTTDKQKWLLPSRLRCFVEKTSIEMLSHALFKAASEMAAGDTSAALAWSMANHVDIRPNSLKSSFLWDREIIELK